MNQQPNLTQRIVRGGLALVTVAALSAGVTWKALAAPQNSASTSTSSQATTTAPAIVHPIAGGRDSYADVVNVVAPAVVTIRVEGKAQMVPTQFGGQDPEDLFRRFFGEDGQAPQPRTPRAYKQRGLGSGVIVSPDGYILTNHHVINGADSIRVELSDGRQLDGKVVGSDEPSDLALVKIEATGLKVLTLGNSDNVQVGDVVLAVGNPLGIGQTVTMGIISAKGRSTASRGEASYEDFLQTDAPINQGNSGGALVSTKGELIGINSQIASMTGGNIGIGFAIPANMARHVMTDLKSGGRVHRAQLGVSIQDVTPEIASSLGDKELHGVIVSSVTPDSAADRAGIKQGDVITAFNGEKVRDGNVLRNHVADSAPGATVPVEVVRDGKSRSLSVKLDEKPGDKQAARDTNGDRDDKASLGINVAPLTPELAARAGLSRTAKGVLVQEVDPNGRAADAGLERGDVIEQVNRQPVQTVDDLRAAVRRSSDRPVLLLVTREGKSIYVTVNPS
jgi:serine protease Do